MFGLYRNFFFNSGRSISAVLNNFHLLSTDTILFQNKFFYTQRQSLILLNYTRLISFLKKCIWGFLIALVNLLDLEDKSPLGAIFNWNVCIVVEKILQALLWLYAWFTVEWLLWKVSFDKVFDFLDCFAITLVWFLLFRLNFLCAFRFNSFGWWFVFYLERFRAFGLTQGGKFNSRCIIGEWFLYVVFSADWLVGWG